MIQTRLTEEDIFKIAREIPAAQARSAYLAQACGDDPALHERVVALLNVAEEEQSFLERPAAAYVQTVAPAPITEKPGDTIGPYKLMEQIGEGGFGLVFVAEQHQPVRRKVALKVIKPGMDTREVVARFEAERQALAMMDHPNIAKVLDAGTTDSGRPYFVMELVRGVPITDYCDSNQLSPRERLPLFIAVCQAVQHAHQKGVIHRDLKPNNILVAPHDGIPVVKVIDFGVAKALGQQLTDKTIYTRFAQLIGTPLYMSPEQAEINALDVDTRSDVYSLGVLLYELLTGTTPFDKQRLHKAAFDEIRRIIREEEPPRPSTRISTLGITLSDVSAKRKTDPSRLSALMRGELDWIVMKCLEKDRTRRYETANGLARDVERYLHDESVEACPPSLGYRLRKFARKYRRLLATAGAFVALLLVAAVVSASLAVRAGFAEAAARHHELEAVRAREETAKERDSAVTARSQTEQANQGLLQAQGDLRAALYGARINLIPGAWETSSLGRVHDLLSQTRPAAGEADLRGFEWHYWQRQLHGELRALKLPRMDGTPSPVLSPSGNRVAGTWSISRRQRRIHVRDTATGNELFSRSIPPERSCVDMELNGDGTRLAWVERDSEPPGMEPQADRPARMRLQVWDVNMRQALLSKEDLYYTGAGAARVYLSEDGTRVALIPHAAEPSAPGKKATNVLTVWEVASGEQLLRQVADPPVQFVEGNLSPDGTRVAAVVDPKAPRGERRLQIWNVADGEQRLDLLVDTFHLGGIAFIPHENRVLLAGSTNDLKQGIMQVYDVAAGQRLASWTEYELGTNKRYAVSADGAKAAVVSSVKPLLRVRELATGRLLLECKAHEGRIDDVALAADGSQAITVAAQGELKEWALPLTAAASPEAGQEFPGLVNWGLTLSAVGTRLAVNKPATPGILGRTPGEVTILDVATGRVIARLPADTTIHRTPSPRMALSPDGTALAMMSAFLEEPYLSVWDVASQRKRFELGPAELGKTIQYYRDRQPFSPDGTSLALSTQGVNETTGREEYRVQVIDSMTGRQRLVLSPPTGCWINSWAFSPDGRKIAGVGAVFTGTERIGQATIWDVASGKVLHQFEHGNSTFFAVAFHPEGTQLAAGSGLAGAAVVQTRGEIVLWDLGSARPLHVLQGHGASIFDLAFTPDGRRLASLGPQPSASESSDLKGELKLWDVASGQERLSLSVDEGSIFELTFSPDGHRLLAPVWNAARSNLKTWDATPLPARVEARAAVDRLVSEDIGWTKGEIIERLRTDPSLTDDLRRATLALAESLPVDSRSLNLEGWRVVSQPDQPIATYGQALRAAERAVEIAPDDGYILNTLGVAQYRVGQYAQAKELLTRTLEMNTHPERGPLPSDLAFLAMACQQLGQNEEAAALLQRLRESMKGGYVARNPENQGFLKEAETLLQSPP